MCRLLASIIIVYKVFNSELQFLVYKMMMQLFHRLLCKLDEITKKVHSIVLAYKVHARYLFLITMLLWSLLSIIKIHMYDEIEHCLLILIILTTIY